MKSLSPVTITALAEVIAGEARSKDNTSLGGKVRSAREIQRFMMEFGIDFSEPFSRVKDLRKCLQALSVESIHKVILGAFDSRSFEKRYVSEESLLYFNRFLRGDGYEVVISDNVPKLQAVNKSSSVIELDAQRKRRFKASYQKEFGPDYGWFINILLFPIVVPFLLLKFLLISILKILGEIIGIAFKYLKLALGVLIAITILVYLVQPSIPEAIFQKVFSSPMFQLFP